MKKAYYLILFAALGLTPLFTQAQKKKNKKDEIWIATPAATVNFAWQGNYRGTIPCEGCQGTQMVLQLKEGNTFKIISKDVGKSDEINTVTGTILWKKEGNYVALISDANNKDTSFALLAKDRLTLLDKYGKKITGANAPFYVLNKDQESVTGKFWKMTELNGKPLNLAPGSKDPFIFLNPGATAFNGFAGCNTLMGNYELGAGNKLTFSGLVTTMMACPNIDMEADVRLALESTDHFVLKGDFLILENAFKQSQAKFEVVYLK